MHQIFQILRIHFRPFNLLVLSVSQGLFAFFLSTEPLEWHSVEVIRLIWLMIGTILLSAAGYLVNDMMNVQSDRINKPDKPLILAGKSIWALYLFMNLCAVLLGWFFIGRQMGFIFLWVFASLFLYSFKIQKWALSGNLLISLLAAMSLLCVQMIVRSIPADIGAFYILFAFLATFIREIAKDGEDLKGDMAAGYRTLPAVIPEQAFKRILQMLLVVFVIFLMFYVHTLRKYFLGPMEWVFLAYLALCVFLPAGLMIFELEKKDEPSVYGRISLVLKYVMITGTCSMMLF